MRATASACEIVHVRRGTNQQGKPFATAYVLQSSDGAVEDVSINLEQTQGEIPEAGQTYDLDLNLYKGQNGSFRTCYGFTPSLAAALK
jgi:hypothetical protein